MAVKPGTLILFALQPLILLALTFWGSTLLPTLANGIAVFMLYAMGILGGMMEQIGYIIHSPSLINIGIVSSLIMPADAIYRKIVFTLLASQGTNFSTLILGPFGAGAEPSFWMLVYTLLYILGFLASAVRIFAKRDL